jgi:hypothetical protein
MLAVTPTTRREAESGRGAAENHSNEGSQRPRRAPAPAAADRPRPGGTRQRELLVTELLEAAKRSAERIRQDARRSPRGPQEARKREAQIVGKAEQEFNRLEAEQERLTEMAGKLRSDLSTALQSLSSSSRPRTNEKT